MTERNHYPDIRKWFLYNIVRIIAGTLIKVGLGMYQPEHVKEILEAGNRNAAETNNTSLRSLLWLE